jgi:hypothetical protein
MYKLKIVVITVVISIIGGSKSLGQAWTQKKGASYSQLGYSSVAGESKYNNSGDPLNLVRKVSDITMQLYHEQGITDRLTIAGNIPIKFVSTGDEIVSPGFSGNTLPAGNLSGLGNISVSAIYGLKQDAKWVYSIQLRTDLKTASEDKVTGLRTGVDAWGIAPSFHIGHGANFFWTSLDFGTNLRTNNYSTQWFSNFQLGTKLGDHLNIIGQFGALQSLEDGNSPDGNSIETGLHTNNIEFVAYSLKLGYEIKKAFTLWGAIGGGLSGNDVTRAPAYSLAISYKK